MTDPDVRRAEREVKESTDEFNQAMDHLEHAVEDQSRKLADAVEKVDRPRRKVMELSSRAKVAAREKAAVAARYLSDRGQQARIVAEPYVRDRRFQIGFAAAGIGLFAFLLFRSFREDEAISEISLGEGRKGEDILCTGSAA